ncbi:MAG: hypothetical protein ABIH39_06985 [Candidatus Margulisiibacteriota bacterium]
MKKILTFLIITIPAILLIWHLAARPEPEFLQVGDDPARKVEIQNTELTGWKKGNKSWRIQADKIWFGNNKDTAFFERIQNGKLYNLTGALIMDKLTGTGGHAYLQQENIFVSGNISGRYFNKKGEKTMLSANHLAFAAAKMDLMGEVKAIQNEFIITASLVIIYPTKNIAQFPLGFNWKSGKEIINADFLEYYLDDLKGIISGNVQAVLEKPTAIINSRAGEITEYTYQLKKDVVYNSADTSFTCDQLEWFRNEGRLTATKIKELKKDGNVTSADNAEMWTEPFSISLMENIVIRRPNDFIKGEKALLGKDNLMMTCGVIIEIDRIKKHIHDEYRESIRGDRMRETLQNTAVIRGNILAHNAIDESTIIKGSAEVVQGGKTARADKITYLTKEGRLLLEQEVQIKEGLEWINCDQLTVDLENAEFIVSGNVKSRILIEK